MVQIKNIIQRAVADLVSINESPADVVDALKVHTKNAHGGWIEQLKKLGFDHEKNSPEDEFEYAHHTFIHPVGMDTEEMHHALASVGFDHMGHNIYDDGEGNESSVHEYRNGALGLYASVDHNKHPSTQRHHIIDVHGDPNLRT